MPLNDPQKECEAKLAATGLAHGKDECQQASAPPGAPPADGEGALPQKCAADSPRDQPCTSYGGTYKVLLEPDPDEKPSCFGTKALETTLRLKGDTKYGNRRDLSWELGGLLKALKVRDKAPSLGSAVRDGVCCIDLDVSEEANGTFKRVVIHLASGASVVNAKASIGCDDSGDRTPLKVRVVRTQ
ncbi:MAG: hypothetical protein SFX73_31220 [Kofleriaceae bacterium]|nr:hypothetical protein [Kofleriaceae bacterium]